jgi:deoxyribodipyrimidine photo-lyase
MRQLNQTGWMHNRLRMITASFLTKDLLIDWRLGKRIFNSSLLIMMQLVTLAGGNGLLLPEHDAVPYFRVFNPTLQGKRFDSKGEFIKKYVPELQQVPLPYLHEPSTLPKELQEALQLAYPKPIVEHSQQRAKVLAFYKEFS